MRRLVPLAIVVLSLPTAPLAAQLSDSVTARVDAVFRDVTRSDWPGCAVGVADGARRYERGYGMSDLQQGIAITPQSIFHVASVSKQFAAMSVALLADEGKLSLDDDVRRYVPEVPDVGTRITVRQLMHHTSGLRDQWTLLSLAGWRFPDDLITERDVLWVTQRQRGLNFRPGDEYLYSNTGFTLLAVITQRVSGRSLRAFAEQRIFAPLGMRGTHFHDDHTMIVPGRTSAYVPRGPDGWRISIPVFDTYGATSLFTTAGDLLTWMAFLDRVRAEDSAWGRVVRGAETSGRLNDGTATDYGFGLSLNVWRGLQAIGHGGADAGYRAFVERYPEHGVAVAVACNHSTANPQRRAREVATAVLGARLPMEMVESRAPEHRPGAAARAAWAGTFVDPVGLGVLEIRVDADSVIASGQRLHFGSDSTASFASGGGYLALERRGERAVIRSMPRGLRQVEFVRQPPAFQTFDAYVGRYRSEELDTEYAIELRDGKLLRVHRSLDEAELRPIARDLFSRGGVTYEFARDRRGRVTGVTVHAGRVRSVAFTRLPSR